MRSNLTAFALALLALSCGGGSPTDPGGGNLAALSHTFPSSVARRDQIEFTAAVVVTSDIGSWEQGGLTVSLPGFLDFDSTTVVEAEADRVDFTHPLPDGGGGFDLIARRADFRAGSRISIRVRARVRADAASGTYTGSMDAVASNRVADQRFLELGIIPIRSRVR